MASRSPRSAAPAALSIAVVGRGARFPGGDGIAAFNRTVLDGRPVLRPCPAPRLRQPGVVEGPPWGLVNDDAAPDQGDADVTDRWLRAVAAEALTEAGPVPKARTAMVVGLSGLPTEASQRYAEAVWTGGSPDVPPTARFNCGLPAARAARALGLGGPVLAVDTACASALNAVALACQMLADGRADAVVVAAAARPDPLYVKLYFEAIGALSPSGRSLPLHHDRDGLLLGEGAGAIVLRRLADAVADGQMVRGVLRAVATGNDGRSRGVFTPDASGQERIMRATLAQAGWRPADVGYVEFHATATRLGDATECETVSHVYAGAESVAVGSVKAVMGHCLAASGMAALLKVLAAFEAGMLPAAPHLTGDGCILPPDGPLRAPTAPEPWSSPRKAAVNAFGFGGNDAQVLLEAWDTAAAGPVAASALPAPADIAVVGLAARLGDAATADALAALPAAAVARRPIALPLDRLRLPPADLRASLPQHALALALALEAWGDRPVPARERVGVFVGAQGEPDAGRPALKARLPALGLTEDTARRLSDALPEADARAMTGTITSLTPNRISTVLDVTGPSLAIAAEEASGTRAVEAAMAALRDGALDVALAGAVDLCAEPVTASALAARGAPAADGGLMVILKRRADAERDRDVILGVLTGATLDTPEPTPAGLPHAAATLFPLAARWDRPPASHVAGPLLEVQPHPPALGATAAVRRLPAPPASPVVLPPEALAVIVARCAAPAAIRVAPAQADGLSLLWHHAVTLIQLDQAHAALTWQGLQAYQQSQSRALDVALSGRPTGTATVPPARQPAFIPAGETAVPGRRVPGDTTAWYSSPPPSDDLCPPSGPAFSRDQILRQITGPLADLFGPDFAPVDALPVRTRVPAPPFTVFDRILGIEGTKGTPGPGRIWTETVLDGDWWILHEDVLPVSMLIEAQAALFISSWMGIDLVTGGRNRFRMLGFHGSFHGGLPRRGDVMFIQMNIDAFHFLGQSGLMYVSGEVYVNGEVRCHCVRSTVGFFTPEDMAAADGLAYDAATAPPMPEPRLSPPPCPSTRRAFSQAQVRAFAAGDAFTCFGPGFEDTASHGHTPRIEDGRLLLIDRVEAFEPTGGPWSRGYLRAVWDVDPEAWFFPTHFPRDPCMPASLMLMAGLQAQTLFFAALGFTRHRDGWRFEPAQGEEMKIQCRAQISPTSRRVVYEVFVHDVRDGAFPMVYADLLCTVDGRKALLVERCALQLAPGTPFERRRRRVAALTATEDAGRPLAMHDGIRQDYRAILNAAYGPARDYLGRRGARYERLGMRVPRLPAPPFLFVSRVVSADITPTGVGSHSILECDMAPARWCHQEDHAGAGRMVALMETAYQAAGYVMMWLDIDTRAERDVCTRLINFDLELADPPDLDGPPLMAEVRAVNISRMDASTLIESSVVLRQGERLVARGSGIISFMEARALDTLSSLPSEASWRADVMADRPVLADLAAAGSPYRQGPLRIETTHLPPLSRLVEADPVGGGKRLGRFIVDSDIDPRHWIFRAHFYNDPVLPGSISVGGLCQMLLIAARHLGLADGLADPVVEVPARGQRVIGKFRGQVRPHQPGTRLCLEIQAVERQDAAVLLRATGTVWTQGLPIYQVENLCLRLTPRQEAPASPPAPIVLAPGDLPYGAAWGRYCAAPSWPAPRLMARATRTLLGRLFVHPALQDAAFQGRPLLFLANHQVGIESILFSMATTALFDSLVAAIAKIEHKGTWSGRLMTALASQDGISMPSPLWLFDRADQAQFQRLMADLATSIGAWRHSLLVHVDGTRALAGDVPVERVTGVLLDFAQRLAMPIVPVRFQGALPPAHEGGVTERRELPVGAAAQDIHFGAPLLPADLADLDYGARTALVLEHLNGVVDLRHTPPLNPARPDLARRIDDLRADLGLGEVEAAFLASLDDSDDPELVTLARMARGEAAPEASGDHATWRQAMVTWFRGEA